MELSEPASIDFSKTMQEIPEVHAPASLNSRIALSSSLVV